MNTRKNGGRVWFTSDPHFHHKLVAETRGYDTPETMNDAITTQWRKQVDPNDTVYILGDVCVSQVKETLHLIDTLPGRKHLIAGNHDEVHPLHSNAIQRTNRWRPTFDVILPYARRRTRGHEFLLCHFPYEDWGDGPNRDGSRYNQYRLPDMGLPLLHGHTHGHEQGHGHSLHIGWDAWGRLVSQEEVIEWLESLD